MTIDTHQIVSAIHSGLGEAWLTAFQARGTPNVEVKPEYLATVMVGRALINEWSLSDAKMGLEFEANACHVATKCFPPRFPPLKRRIPARRTGKKFDREKVDIVIFERPDSWSSLAKHVIEIKVSNIRQGLEADLLRNKRLMELTDDKSQSALDSAFLAFVEPGDGGVLDAGSEIFRDGRRGDISEKLAHEFSSEIYSIRVSVETISVPKHLNPFGGEYRHFLSVVIAFVRNK